MLPEHDFVLMTLTIFTPAAFALALLLFPKRAGEAMKWWALFGAGLTFVLSTFLLIDYYNLLDARLDVSGRPLHGPGTSLETRASQAAADLAAMKPRLSYDSLARRSWISKFSIDYFIGIDGISMPLILLTTVLCFLGLLASWSISERVRAYLILFLLLETGVLGAFLALDFFLFYVFYEIMLVPMFFLIGLWGGPRRESAALKFFVFTLAGSVLILAAMLGLYFTDVRDFVDPSEVQARAEHIQRTNPSLTLSEAEARVTVHTFDMLVLAKAGRAAYHHLHGLEPDSPGHRAAGNDPAQLAGVSQRLQQPFFTPTFQFLFFGLLFVGFAIKVPLPPLHTWLPDAHVEAPTPVSMILAGVLLKLGGYGLLRVAWPMCPWAAEQLAWWIALAAALAIVYGAFLALGQTDFKKLLAYSSISHMGYVVLGLAVWAHGERGQYWAWGVNGAIFQMVAHGITAAALFFVVGVAYERSHHRDLNRYRGLMGPMPIYGGLSAVIFLAAMGLPGLCGFVGEVFVMLAAWNFSPALASLAIAATVITAGYMLWTLQRVFYGTNPQTAGFADVSLREALTLTPLAVLAVVLGVMPGLLLNWVEPSATGWVESLSQLPR